VDHTEIFNLPSQIHKVDIQVFEERGLQVYVKRDDLIHPQISGNKWRKLKYNIEYIQTNKIPGFITFGGAYSNHIYACAALSKLFGIPSIGIIRGDEIQAKNETLQFAEDCGMLLYFVSRASYREKEKSEEIKKIISKHSDFMLIPEGGSNERALLGVHEIIDEILDREFQFDFICVPAGTGATAAGLLQRMTEINYAAQLIVNNSLKGDWMESEILQRAGLIDSDRLKVLTDYHFGGYAKSNFILHKFIEEFTSETQIQIDHIYNAKLIFGLVNLVEKGYFQDIAKILWIHTGGLR
jgi:1-aminocyclopropane-1-carboxylate deaminase